MTRVALLLALAACATVPTARSIAGDLDRCLTSLSTWPLSTRCQCLTDADQRCVVAGYARRCWADGWVDADHDAWTIAACAERRQRGLE